MMPLAWRLSAAQWDVLTELLGLEGYPAPIQVRSTGRTRLEHARVRADVCVQLNQLGLLRAGRIDADLEAAVRLLHWPTTWVDSVWLADAVANQPVRVIAARGGAAGVCVLQHPDQPGATLLEVIATTGLAAAVVSRLPAHPPGRSSAVTVQPYSAQPTGGLLVAASPVRSNAERNLAAAAAIWTNRTCEPGRSPRMCEIRRAGCVVRTYRAGATTSTAATTSWPTGNPTSRRR